MMDCALTVARFLKNTPTPLPSPPPPHQDISTQCCLFRHLQTGTLLSKQSTEGLLLPEHLGWGERAVDGGWTRGPGAPLGGTHISHEGCEFACQKDVLFRAQCQQGWQGQHRNFDCSLLQGSRLPGATNLHLAAGLLIELSSSHTPTLSWPKLGTVSHISQPPRVSVGPMLYGLPSANGYHLELSCRFSLKLFFPVTMPPTLISQFKILSVVHPLL